MTHPSCKRQFTLGVAAGFLLIAFVIPAAAQVYPPAFVQMNVTLIVTAITRIRMGARCTSPLSH